MTLLKTPPLGLYVHIPWCVRKCPYCDFNSHAAEGDIPEDDYVRALLADLDGELILLNRADQRSLQSIFIGGGTPSLFSGKAITRLLEGIGERLAFSPTIEITLEANPGTAERARFAAFRRAGVNRLSIGVQSFNNARLHELGRIHNSEDARAAVRMAHEAGFERINLDLMHGLPGQDPDEALQDLREAINHGPEHLSWYQLTLEPNTAFYSNPPALPTEDTLAEIQEVGQELLADAGYVQYEVSAYCRLGAESIHNRNYWTFADYIGIGAGAHGKLTGIEKGEIQRRWKVRQPRAYLDNSKSFLAGSRVISEDELPLEFMMNALRLSNGCTSNLFEARTGLGRQVLQKTLDQLIDKGLMYPEPGLLKTTPLGQRYLNDVLGAFMP
jgi:oxygen-independent coproporphyrinogen-3 oxidase